MGGGKAEEKKKRGAGAGVSADAEARPGRAGGQRRGRAGAGADARVRPVAGSKARVAQNELRPRGATENTPGSDSKRTRKERGVASFAAPSAADAATQSARGGGSLRWRMKRPRTRSAVGRPATGPTSWAATCAFALWRRGELRGGESARRQREPQRRVRTRTRTSRTTTRTRTRIRTFRRGLGGAPRDVRERARGRGVPRVRFGDGWVEDDIVFDQFDHFDELAADDEGWFYRRRGMDLGFDE